MAKYYDIYTQIPGIKPCPQVWIVEEGKLDIINQLLYNRDFIVIKNIVGTTAKKIWSTKTLLCLREYFICMVESQAIRSDDE